MQPENSIWVNVVVNNCGKLCYAVLIVLGLGACETSKMTMPATALIDGGRIKVMYPAEFGLDGIQNYRDEIENADEVIRTLYQRKKRSYVFRITNEKRMTQSFGGSWLIMAYAKHLMIDIRAIWHEIAHTYTTRSHDLPVGRRGKNFPRFYGEGLAVWVQKRVDWTNGDRNLARDLHMCVWINNLHVKQPAAQVISNFDHNNLRKQQWAHYMVAGSFGQYHFCFKPV